MGAIRVFLAALVRPGVVLLIEAPDPCPFLALMIADVCEDSASMCDAMDGLDLAALAPQLAAMSGAPERCKLLGPADLPLDLAFARGHQHVHMRGAARKYEHIAFHADELLDEGPADGCLLIATQTNRFARHCSQGVIPQALMFMWRRRIAVVAG